MIVLGLTGSIGMGKTTVAQMFAEQSVPVFEADAAVHALYRGPAVPLIEQAFPGTTRDGEVDRAVLARAVVGDADALQKLESIVHPMVQMMERAFLDQARAAGAPLAVIDIPLLFEKGSDVRTDLVAVVSAPPDVQRARVLARPGMTAEKFEQLLARQMPDAQKRARADIVIDTGASLEDTAAAVRDIVKRFSESPSPAKG